MRVIAFAIFAALTAFSLPAQADEVDTCVNAAAASDHIPAKDVDRDACVCATKELHATLKPGDFDLHEKMLELIAGGADEKSFNRQMSDIMLKRGMTQANVDAFLARSHKAEAAAQDKCNSSPLLTPQTPGKARH